MNQRPFGRGCLIGNDASGSDHLARPIETLVATVVDGSKRFTGGDGVSNFFVQHDPHPRIDGIFLALASTAKNDARGSNLFALHAANETVLRAEHLHAASRLRESLGIINDSRIASLQLHHLAEFFERLPRGKQLLTVLLSFGDALRRSSQMQHPTGSMETQLFKILRPARAQHLKNFQYLERIPDLHS